MTPKEGLSEGLETELWSAFSVILLVSRMGFLGVGLLALRLVSQLVSLLDKM